MNENVAIGNGLGRRQFIAGAAGVGLGVAGAGFFPAMASAETAPVSFGGYPQFTWTTVPTAANFDDMFRTWSANEASFIANHFSLASIEKGHGHISDPNGWTEPGFLHDARLLKSFDQPTKVVYYWNGLIFRDIYQSTENFPSQWLLPRADGRFFFDLNNPDVRRWVVDAAVQVVAERDVDGVFIDAVATAVRGIFGLDVAVTLMEDFRTSLDSLPGEPRLLMHNAQLATLTDDNGGLDPLVEISDGTMIELFDYQPAGLITAPEEQKRWMLDMGTAAKAGKIVIFKTWPSFSFLTDLGRNAPYEEKVARARAEITFPLAAFLAAAQRHCYLQYSWGWNVTGVQPDNGVLVYPSQDSQTVDPTWYPELLRPLGAPLGDAHVDGYVFTRSFAHADVWVDLEAHDAQIDWK